MKQRQFEQDAQELCAKRGEFGKVAFAKECLELGYSLGLHDATAEVRHANDVVAEQKRRSNLPS